MQGCSRTDAANIADASIPAVGFPIPAALFAAALHPDVAYWLTPYAVWATVWSWPLLVGMMMSAHASGR